MNSYVAGKIRDALTGLARVNQYEFCQDRGLRRSYVRALRQNRNVGGIVYVPDPDTCGLPDCWSTWRGLTERYGRRAQLPAAAPYQQRIPLDCEDIAAAHAGYLSAVGTERVYMGFVPGKGISHAVCGVRGKGGMQLIDPAVWVGMGDFKRPYEPVLWGEV